MILPFKEHFVQPIQAGIKIHTLRQDLFNRWCAGKQIHMAIHVRTPHYYCFNDKHKCVSTQKVIITTQSDSQQSIQVWIDGRELTTDEINTLAVNDGFTGIAPFRWWFLGGFNGKIIHWTNLKY